jgi:hypothetical protein
MRYSAASRSKIFVLFIMLLYIFVPMALSLISDFFIYLQSGLMYLTEIIKQVWKDIYLLRFLIYFSITLFFLSLVIRMYFFNRVSSYSKAIIELRNLNKDTQYHKLNQKELITYSVNSKRSLDRINPRDFMLEKLVNKNNPFIEVLKKSNENSSLHSIYKDKVEKIALILQLNNSDSYSFINFVKMYQKHIEKVLFNRLIIERPIIDPIFQVVIEYTSPQGINSYKKEIEFNTKDYLALVEISKSRIQLLESEKNKKIAERRKLTDTLRFKILKKYNYRCQICGKSASIGVQLHVDHKVPIAKGGKTIESNLWVLCDRCNLGKGTRNL